MHTMSIKASMKTGYSLLVDECVDVNLAEPVDCDALRVCCHVCQERVVLEAEVGAPSFRSRLTI
jgi:hypothetical protein